MVPVGLGVGLTTVSMGLIHALESRGIAVKYLNPFETTIEKVEKLLSSGKEEVVLEEVIAQVAETSKHEGVLIVQGIISTQLRQYAPRLNHEIAKALDAEVVFVTTPGGKSPAELKEQMTIAAKPYGGIESPRTIGCMINKVGAPIDQYGNARIDLFDLPENVEETSALSALFTDSKFKVLGCFPWKRQLMAPRVKDVAKYLDAEIISAGNMDQLRVNFFALAGATVEHVTSILIPDVMVMTPADRSDTLIAAAIAFLRGIKIAGVILTGDYDPPPKTLELCSAAFEKGLPLLKVKTDSLRTAISLQNLNMKIPEDDLERRSALKEYVASFIHPDWVKELMATQTERRLSPPAFKHQLMEMARKSQKRIVLPEGEEPRMIEAAMICVQKGIAKPVLLGNPETIRRVAENNGIMFDDGLEIIDPIPLREKYLPLFLELRRHKGITEERAKETLQDNLMVGTLMLHAGEVDGLVAGTVHTTAQTIRPALSLIKTKEGVKKVSSIFFMCLPQQVLVYGDCAVNPNPTVEELADIAIQCADSATRFGIPPRVAMISYSTGESGAGAEVTKVSQATTLVKERRPDLIIDGPLQYDAAFSPDVAEKKAPNSPVAGKATVYVFPDLNTANTTYKAVQRSADVLSIGPMLQGLKKPVNDLSRGALVDDIVYTIAITAIQAE